jgi:hypothetical protein
LQRGLGGQSLFQRGDDGLDHRIADCEQLAERAVEPLGRELKAIDAVDDPHTNSDVAAHAPD